MKHAETDLGRLKNLGPVSIDWLVQCGITSRAELEDVGAVMAYKIVKHHVPQANLNLLYGIQAALMDIHWNALPQEVKARLKAEAASPLTVSLRPRA